MAYQPKSYRKFLAGTVSAAVVKSAITTDKSVDNIPEHVKTYDKNNKSYRSNGKSNTKAWF